MIHPTYRCNCGVHRYDRCPDRHHPEHRPDDRMAPIWAGVISLVVCVLAGAAVAGAYWMWQVIT